VSAPRRTLRARGRAIELGGAPLLMGIVNATPDSFSDAGQLPDVEARVARARVLAAAGAGIVDVGGESAVGGRPAVDPAAEIARVVPVVERIVAELDAVVSVDTYKPAVAEAAVEAGAAIVNDVSGLRDPAIAEVCARTGAGLVIMHTRVAPKGTLLDPDAYADVAADVRAFLAERMALALEAGVGEAQTVTVLRAVAELHALGRPLLLPVSRKDFLGAITGRRPRDRGAATLAAVGWAADVGAHIIRVHDVAAAADFLAVRSVLHGDRELAPAEGLTPDRYPDGMPASLQRAR